MKLGIISDIHGNLTALEAAVAVLRAGGATQFACCGDIVGYGPYPNECVESVRGLRCRTIAGNHDLGATGRIPLTGFSTVARRALEWTKAELTKDNLGYLEDLPLTDRLGVLQLVHATPSAPDLWEYVLTVREAEEEMESYAEPACVAGHSHRPFVVEKPGGQPARLLRQESFELREDCKYFINAGSVGQPRDSDPRACCLLFDARTRVVTTYRVAYEVAPVQQRMRELKLPEFLVTRLASGR
jgi:diadenosine tetraphosphatase ApaH/serine/threonine PP2A family protein phosphatase